MAELKVPRKTQSFAVPADAISFNRNGMQVAVVSNGKAEIRTAVPAIRKSPEEAALPWLGRRDSNLYISKSDLLNLIPPQRHLGVDRARL